MGTMTDGRKKRVPRRARKPEQEDACEANTSRKKIDGAEPKNE
jgi:hypothetical protein